MRGKLKVIITGATGMIGEGVLHECLLHEDVETILLVTRKPTGVAHQKCKEIVHADFTNITPILEEMKKYNTCFFCSGVSSVGMTEAEYNQKTFILTTKFATALNTVNPELTFCYISGSATDSSEKGRIMWARVKGRTENELLRTFKSAYMFRPGYMHPTPGLKNVLPYYKYISWMYPFLHSVFPKFVCSMKELGLSMILVALKKYDKRILEVKDIVETAKL